MAKTVTSISNHISLFIDFVMSDQGFNRISGLAGGNDNKNQNTSGPFN